MKTLLERKISLVVIILQFLVSLLVCIYFGTTGLVPVKYMVAIAVVMVVLLVLSGDEPADKLQLYIWTCVSRSVLCRVPCWCELCEREYGSIPECRWCNQKG